MGHRYYNPEWGRWIQPDDIEYLDPTNINGLNLYAYCNNDPVNKYDPTGHFAISALLIIGGIIVSGAITGLGAMANKEDHESNLGAFVGGFIDGAVGALAVAAGLATGGAAGLLLTAGIAFVGGFTGNAVGQSISYGDVQWDLSFMQGGISMLTNSFIFGGLSMAGITQGITWASRFADALKISEVAVGITSFFTTYSLPSVNKLRRNY